MGQRVDQAPTVEPALSVKSRPVSTLDRPVFPAPELPTSRTLAFVYEPPARPSESAAAPASQMRSTPLIAPEKAR